MKCVCNIPSKHLAFPFLMAFFVSIRICFLFYMQNDYNQTKEKINWQEHSLFLTALMFVGEFLIGILFPYFKNLTRLSQHYKYQEKQYLILSQYKIDKIQAEKQSFNLTYFYLFLGTILDYICIPGIILVTSFIGESSQTSFALKCLQIISTGLLCYYILHFNIYRHQIVAIALVIFGIILVTWNHLEKEIQSFWHVALLFIIIFISSLQETIDKWIMDVKEVQPLKLLFYEGIMGFSLSVVLVLILAFIPCPDVLKDNKICKEYIEDIRGMFIKIDWLNGVFIMVWILCSIGYNLFSRYSNYYLTPTHRTISDTLSTFILWIYLKIKGNIDNEEKGMEFISTIIGYIILIFGCLFYNEIIIIRFCNLDYNTKFEISKRAVINELEIEEIIEEDEIITTSI